MTSQIPDTFVWSFSSLSSFKKCPYSFYRTYVLKDRGELPSTFFGTALHEYAERFAKREVVDIDSIFKKNKCDPLDRSEFEFCCSQVKSFIEKRVFPFRFIVESQHNFLIKDTSFTMKLDLIINEGGVLHVWDYKSSRNTNYVADYYDQAALYLIGLSKIYPEKKCDFHFYFPRCEAIEEGANSRNEEFFSNSAEAIRACSNFKPKTSILCKWCPYKEKKCPVYKR